MIRACNNLLVAILITSSGLEMVAVGQTLGAITLASYSEENEAAVGGITNQFLNSCVVSLTKNLNACRWIVKNTNSVTLKTLAAKIIEDDEVLLKEARILAAKLDVTVPYNSELNQELKSNSSNNEKADVDKEFTKIALEDLRNTIESFRAGAECEDRWARAFASSGLSTLENHLMQVTAYSTSTR